MTRVSTLVAVAAVAAASAGPAAAYVRTSNEVTGAEVFWPVPVVAYHLSSAQSFTSESCAPTAAGDPLEAAVRASFAEWEQGCTDLQLLYGGRIPETRTALGGTSENVVVLRRGWCSQDPIARADPCMTDPDVDCGGIYDCFEDVGPADWGFVALTTVLYNPNTGRIYDADMAVNAWDGTPASVGTPLKNASGYPPHGYYFTCDHRAEWPACTTYGQPGCNAYDLQNTVTHEVGHFVGFAHPCETRLGYGVPLCSSALPAGESVAYADRTMFPTTSMGELTKRTLSADDVDAVCGVYPEQSGGCGSAGGAPGALAVALAALALRRRVRK